MSFLDRIFTEMGRRFIPDQKDSDIRDMETVYFQNRGSFHIVEIDGQIHGSVGVRPFAENIAELKRLYLSREHRSKGLGQALCQVAIEDAKNLGYQYLRLDTAPESVEAISLFKKLGFYEIENYAGIPYAELFLEKAL